MIKIAVFDAYGTLFDVSAAARTLSQEKHYADLANIWPKLAELWRNKQLEYSWLRAITGDHVNFWQVTSDGLRYALAFLKLDEGKFYEPLMALYKNLDAYEDVPELLKTLKTNGVSTAILSNGAPEMLEAAVQSAGLSPYLDEILSVERVGVFKPDPAVYQMVLEAFSCAPHDVLFVSSNGWDAAGAKGFGFTTVWVNRAGLPQDRLFAHPDYEFENLTKIRELTECQNSQHQMG